MDGTNDLEWSDGARSGAWAGAADVLGGDTLGRALARWAAEASVDEAARRRAREHWLRIQAEEEASVIGTLVDLAERGRRVVLDIGGHAVRGHLRGIGADFVAVRAHDHDVLVRTSAIEVVRTEPGTGEVVGDRSVVVEVGLGAVMGPLAADRPSVAVRTRSGTVVRGELRSAGTDVVRIRLDGDERAPVWVSLAAVDVVVIEP